MLPDLILFFVMLHFEKIFLLEIENEKLFFA